MTQSKYAAVMNWIQNEISIKELRTGDLFYTESEICEMLGVSRQTVRNAMGKLEADNVLARRRGSGTYIASGRSIKANRSKTIGVIVPHSDDHMIPSILRGIERTSTQSGYKLQLAFTHYSLELEYNAMQSMLNSEVDGVIFVPSHTCMYSPNASVCIEFEHKQIPLIFLDSYYIGASFHHISLDHVAAGRLATEYLLNAGHKRIAGFFMTDFLQGNLRYQGYVQAHQSYCVPFNPNDVIWCQSQHLSEFHKNASSFILNRLKGYTALVCYNDHQADLTARLLLENDLRIPEDISITSIDDSALAASSPVPLTSVVHPKESFGLKAVENIIKLINDPDFDATFEFEPTITARESVKSI